MTTPQSPYPGHPEQPPHSGQYAPQYPQQGGQYPPQGQYPPHGAPPPAWGPAPHYTQAPPPAPQPPKKKRTGLKIALGVVVAIVVIGIATGGGGEQAPTTAAGGTAAAPAPAAAGGEQSVTFGQEATSGDLTLSVSPPKQVTEFGMTQACSTVTYRNNGSTPASFNLFDWTFTTPAGVEASASIPFNVGAKALNSGQLAPGGSTSGMVCGDQQTTDVSGVKYAPAFSLSDPITWTN